MSLGEESTAVHEVASPQGRALELMREAAALLGADAVVVVATPQELLVVSQGHYAPQLIHKIQTTIIKGDLCE